MRCSETLRDMEGAPGLPGARRRPPEHRGAAPAIAWRVRLALVALMVMPVTPGYQALRAAADRPLATAVAQAPERAWPNEAYRVEWEEAHVPEEAAANLVLAVPVTLRNAGNRVWPVSLVFVSYHWFRDEALVSWDGVRTRLPRDLRAGGRATVAVRVKTPAEPGSYLLQLSLVHENVIWFEHKGADTLVRPIVVRAATTPVDCGDGGSTPCTR